jgi:CubicO group peptidase (beta-lactamase class C family)
MQVAVLDAKREKIVDKVPAARKITIQDLFRHTNVMSYGARGTTAVHKLYLEGSGQAALGYTSGQFVDHLATLSLHFSPGTTWDYGFGLDVLAIVVEQLTGQTLGGYLGHNVFKPLGMVDTSFLIPAAKPGRCAKGAAGRLAAGADIVDRGRRGSNAAAAARPRPRPITYARRCCSTRASSATPVSLARKTVDYMPVEPDRPRGQKSDRQCRSDPRRPRFRPRRADGARHLSDGHERPDGHKLFIPACADKFSSIRDAIAV